MSRTESKRSLRLSAAAMLAVIAMLVAPVYAFGHAVVYPRTSTTGAHEKYVLRVPNEKAVATTRVEIHFPADVKVSSFADVPGWQLEILTDSAKHIIGAVWTGTLPPERFAEFPFVAANPKADAQLAWATYQTYADGMRVEWTGAPGSKSPASVTTISAPAPAAGSMTTSAWVSWAALAIAIVSLGLALRPRAA